MKIGVLLCLTLSAVNSHLFPENHIITYKYETIIETTVEKPTLFTSQVFVEADFVIKSYNKQIVANLKNVTYSMHNGKGKKLIIKPKFFEITEESKSIELPFAIEYERNGMVNTISTEANDEAWSINMKKAIAATLQLDLKQILATNTFYSNESTIHGQCKTFYTVHPQKESRLIIAKHTNPVSCEGFKWKSYINVGPSMCEKKLQNPLAISSDRYYEVSKQDNGIFIDRVETINSIILTPFRSNSDFHSIITNQTLLMIKYEKLKDETPGKVKRFYQKLKIEYNMEKDLPYRMTKNTSDAILNNIKMLLENTVEQLNHIKIKSSLSEKLDFSAGNLLYQLRLLDLKNLERLNEQLAKSEGYTLFLETLPHIGTYASHLLIKILILERKLPDEYQSRKMLRELPFYIEYPDTKLITDLFPLTTENSISESTRNVAKFTVSTIINKILKKYPEDDEVQRYVDDYIEKFTTSEKYLDKLTYLGSLLNIDSKKTIEFVEKFIKENKPEVAHLRSIAIWGIKNRYVEDTDHFDKIFWPLLENESEDLQVRFAAMSTLMQNPSADNLLKMHWYMQNVKDEELYKVFYDYLESYSGSTLPCFNKLSLRSKQILTIAKKPKLKRSFVQLSDYFDSHFGFGAQFKTVMIGNIDNNKYMTFYHQIIPHVANMNFNQNALYIHVDASENEKIHHSSLVNYYKSLFSNIQMNLYKLIIIHYKNNKIVSIVQTNAGDPDFMENFDSKLLTMINKEPNYDFDQYVFGKSFLTTDIGMIVVSYISTPSIVQLKHYREYHEQNMFKLKYANRENQAMVLALYNPLANIWQGTQRSAIFNFYFPIDFNFYDNIITFKHEEGMTYGFETYVSNNVFLIDNEIGVDTLKVTCPNCNNIEVVTKGETYTKKIWETKFLGFTSSLELFDCEQNIDTLRTNLFDKFINNNYNPFTKILIVLHHLWTYSKTLPGAERCGIRFAIKPEHTLTNISFGRFPMHIKDEKTYEGFKYETYQNDKVKDWWSCLLNHNNTRSKFKAHCTYHQNNKIYKICIERTINYGQEFNHKTQYILSAGYVDDIEKCPESSTITVDVNQSKSQEIGNIVEEIVSVCDKKVAKIACITDNLLSNNISLNIHYKNLPLEIVSVLNDFANTMKKVFSKYFINIEGKNTEEGNIKVNLKWKHIEFISPTKSFAFRYLNDENWNLYDLLPIDLHYAITYTFKNIDNCEIGVSHIRNFDFEELWMTSSEWTQIAAYSKDWEIYTKLEGSMRYLAFRIISSNEKLDIQFKENLELYFNGELLDNQDYINKEWFNLKVYDPDRIVILYLKKSKRTIVFDEGYRHSLTLVKVILPNEYFTNECQLKNRLLS